MVAKARARAKIFFNFYVNNLGLYTINCITVDCNIVCIYYNSLVIE